jgi:EpsI family protein
VWWHPAAAVHEGYAGASGRVGIHIFYYRNQGAESKLVSSLNRVLGLNDRAWFKRSQHLVEVPVADGGRAAFSSMGIEGSGSGIVGTRPHLVAWHAYWIDGQWVTSDLKAKLANASARLQGRGDDGASVILYAMEGSPEASTATLKAFAASNLSMIDGLLRRTRDSR